jgi:KUP system potassium uptake protein
MSNQVRDQRLSAKALLSLTALGVVYGDIGTSPLYALRECFNGDHALALTSANVLGVLSLIFWSLIVIITIKYLNWVMRADNGGEGGMLALLALAVSQSKKAHSRWERVLVTLGLIGTALMYGDSMITPAMSILSAVEGLSVATKFFDPYILIITISILCLLFYLQKRGTAKVGRIFGPIMLTWFTTMAALGVYGILNDPTVFRAINPIYAYHFFAENHMASFLALGAVFLVVTGGEALYADMGHFGPQPIRMAWYFVCLPALLLNYFGQGALILTKPEAAANPFFLMAPSYLLYPIVGIATLAAAFASQAVISGAFSLTRQAVQLGYSPRLQIDHTSSSEIGQIYIPYVNWALLASTIWLVLTFQSSGNLAAAYGIAVSGTMVITTILLTSVTATRWNWPWPFTAGVLIVFLPFDLTYFVANAAKVAHGGWFPIMVAAIMFTLMTTWRRGRRILAVRLRAKSRPIESFLKDISAKDYPRVSGTAVFMNGDPTGTPLALLQNVKHNKVIHEKNILLTISTSEQARVLSDDRVVIEKLSSEFTRIIAYYGFMETPSIDNIVAHCNLHKFRLELKEMTFFLGHETLIASDKPGMAIWREKLFSFMTKNAQRATDFFGLPATQVIEVGGQVEL